MRVIVQKFGGTCLSTAERRARVTARVREAREAGFAVAVVVSAMGRAGDPYATDTLLGLLADEGLRAGARDTDLLLSCGEIISAVTLADALISRGIRAIPLTGGQAGIITDGVHGNARIVEVLPARLSGALEGGSVAVVAGFQGVGRTGEVTTLGRGGSDTSAAALGVALRAELVEIYTDVEGVMTADPRLLPTARTLPAITYREVAEMAHLGAKVIHPRAVEIAMIGRVPLKIRSLLSDDEGTLISDGRQDASIGIRGDRVVTGIAHVAGLGQIVIRSGSSEKLDKHNLGIFTALAQAGISVDMINVSPELISFVVSAGEFERARQLVETPGLRVEARQEMAKVSAVGSGMMGVPGVMRRVLAALGAAGVGIFQTTDSHANISCLVPEAALSQAIAALHQEFQLDQVPGGA